MTVSSSTARADYNGNGSTTAFTVPFYFLNTSHLLVLSTVVATGVSTTLVLGTDYTVTGAGVPAGGTVTTTVAPITGVKLSILRNVPITQTYHYVANDPFPAASHENAIDLLTMEVQQVNEVVSRAVKLPAGTAASSSTLPQPSANSLIGWDSTALALINYGAVDNTTLALQLGVPTGSSLVGHIATGTGAIARTVQSKLRDTVSVKDFGAVGDGVTNDSPAFVLAAAAANVIIVPYSSASYKLDSSVTASGKHFIIYGTLSGAGVLLQNSSTQFATNNFKIGNASLFGYTDNASAMQCYANTGTTAPTGIVPSFRNVVASKGDNTTFIGAQAGYFEARDRADVTGANKGVLYALSLSVVPTVARNNVPFDDVDGLTISNTTGTVGAKATDAIYVSNNTTAFGNKSTGTSEWYSIFTADCNADVGLAFNGKLLNYGIDLRLANISSSAAIAIPNATYLYSRNASNSADAQLIGLDTNNIIALGGSASAGISVKNWLGTTAPSVVSTGTYSVGLNDNNLIFTAACTVTLPNAGSFNGRILNVKGTTANAIISASSNVVGLTGTTSTAILAATAGKWAVLISDGANWQIMSAN